MKHLSSSDSINTLWYNKKNYPNLLSLKKIDGFGLKSAERLYYCWPCTVSPNMEERLDESPEDWKPISTQRRLRDGTGNPQNHEYLESGTEYSAGWEHQERQSKEGLKICH